MRYLFGDSTESGLEFNYLAFIRDVVDSAVVLVECDASLATTDDRKKAKERDAAAIIAGIEELGKRTAHLVAPLVKERDESPVGRCATAIAIAAKEAIERESSQVRAALSSGLAAIEAENAKLRKRSVDVFDRLLKMHDLPNAEKVFEVAWTSSGLKAAMRQRTTFGIEAVLALDIPSNSLFTTDLRVDKLSEGVEINALEPGGWLKKGDKLVPIKLGRYHITRVVVGSDVTVRVRSTAEANASAFELTTDRDGEIRIERLGGTTTAREFSIEDHNQPKLRQLTDKLAAAARALADHRTSVVSVEVDGAPLADHKQPRAVAERMILAIAPTVVKIARHSRSPGELVLRRMLGDDRREEIFIPVSELQKKIDMLPANARDIFAPLQLDGDAAPQYIPPSPSATSRARGKTVPPPPPPPALKHQHPTAKLPGITVLPAQGRGVHATMPVDDEIEEISPDSSGVVLPAVARDTVPSGATGVPTASPDDETLDTKSGRMSRPTKQTDPPQPRDSGPVIPKGPSTIEVEAPDVVEQKSGEDEEEPVALDVMKASDDMVEAVDEPRKKSESLGSAIDSAIEASAAKDKDATPAKADVKRPD